jgi:spore coat protein U-like protein
LVARKALVARIRLMAAVVLVVTSGMAAVPARAATSTAAFAVTVTVQASCQITATALGFTTYTGALDVATSAVTLICTDTTTYNVGLSAGSTPGATVGTRQMASGPSRLAYALYSDAGRTVNWGNTVGTDTVAGTGNGNSQVLTVYGRVAAGQLVKPGTYSDTVIATVTY